MFCDMLALVRCWLPYDSRHSANFAQFPLKIPLFVDLSYFQSFARPFTRVCLSIQFLCFVFLLYDFAGSNKYLFFFVSQSGTSGSTTNPLH